MHKQTVVDVKSLGRRLIFKNPVKELIADDLHQVPLVLEEVEAFQKQGYYVVGYVSYEASKAFESKFNLHSSRLSGEYLAYFTVHKSAEEVDFIESYDEVEMPNAWKNETSQEEYERAIAEIHSNIRQGNTYQVNYTIQLTSKVTADSFAIYNRLVVEQGAAYNIFVEHDDFAVISASPELFFQTEGQTLRTRPMKGTTGRGFNLAEDREKRDWLANDVKNRAENMMIVDLLRNDMGRISEISSVQVTSLCELEPYSTVWQMTSTIESRIKEDTTLVDIFQALFPCGSITGAPKIATIDIISRLEPKPRGVYCGTLGICLPNGNRIFNVAIRSLQVYKNQAIYGVGGGITWDSNWQDEYQETKQKSAVLYRKQPRFDLITTAKVTKGHIDLLDYHLERLQESSAYFSYPFNLDNSRAELESYLESLNKTKDYRLRLSLTKSGQLECHACLLEDLPQPLLKAQIHQRQESIEGPFVYYKTSYRPHLPKAETEQIFISKEGYLQETTIGNLVLEIGGELLTPPLSVGILAGIYRKHLLKTGQVKECLLTKEDLKRADAVYACNAVRGLYKLDIL